MAEPLNFPFRAGAMGPAAFADPLPAEADLVVIGGGVAGVSTALFAARRGLRVVLCEKGRVAAEQSGRNWGWIRQQGRDPDELPIMVEAIRLWQDLAAEVDTDIGLRQAGVTYLARDTRTLARYETWLPHGKAHGLDTRVFGRDVAELLFPGAGWVGGMTTGSDMRAEPWLAVPALARLARSEGVAIREDCAVRALDLSGGTVAGVVTEAGRVRAPAVALTAGAWSRLFLARHGIPLPQLSVRSSVAATGPLPQVWDGGAVDDRLAFRRRADGGYTLAGAEFNEVFLGRDAFASARAFLPRFLANPWDTRVHLAAPAGWPDAWGTPRRWSEDGESPFERMRILDPAPNHARLDRVRRLFAAAFPQIGPVRLVAKWAGMIDAMPDIVPVIGALPMAGLWTCTGLSGHGFGIGPAVGRVLADLIAGHPPGHDLTRFRHARFTDGSPLKPGPTF